MAVEAPPTLIAELRPEHWPAVARIYAEGIETGDATFETEVPAWEIWDGGHLDEHRFVAMRDEDVVGWVAARAVSDRCAYAGVVEHSVYVAETARAQGVGRGLLEALIASTEAAGVWTIQTGIFPENTTSLRLHERAGFEVVGRRKRIGKLAGVWRDVIAVERRSPVVD
jgi:phosphinothricin acetyltransferase